MDRLRSRRRGWQRAALAAGVAAFLVAGGVFLAPWSSHDRSVSTRIGEQREVTLEDGSIVNLDTNSALSIHFSRHARHVHLVRGQAYFTVAHSPNLPFIVDAGSVKVTATGTQFDVRQIGDRIEVTLVQGGVDIRSGDSLSRLVSGQKLRILPGRNTVPERVDLALATAWTHGQLVLDGVSLAHAIEEVNRYTDRPVRLADPTYADAKFSGSLKIGDIPGFVAAVTAMLPLRPVTDKAGSVRLVVGQEGQDQKCRA
jgi:transmembrane sensor